jgi:hypothetical protein
MMLEATNRSCTLVHRALGRQAAARLNCIFDILQLIQYKKISRSRVELLKRSNKGQFDDQVSLKGMKFVAESY